MTLADHFEGTAASNDGTYVSFGLSDDPFDQFVERFMMEAEPTELADASRGLALSQPQSSAAESTQIRSGVPPARNASAITSSTPLSATTARRRVRHASIEPKAKTVRWREPHARRRMSRQRSTPNLPTMPMIAGGQRSGDTGSIDTGALGALHADALDTSVGYQSWLPAYDLTTAPSENIAVSLINYPNTPPPTARLAGHDDIAFLAASQLSHGHGTGPEHQEISPASSYPSTSSQGTPVRSPPGGFHDLVDDGLDEDSACFDAMPGFSFPGASTRLNDATLTPAVGRVPRLHPSDLPTYRNGSRWDHSAADSQGLVEQSHHFGASLQGGLPSIGGFYAEEVEEYLAADEANVTGLGLVFPFSSSSTAPADGPLPFTFSSPPSRLAAQTMDSTAGATMRNSPRAVMSPPTGTTPATNASSPNVSMPSSVLFHSHHRRGHSTLSAPHTPPSPRSPSSSRLPRGSPTSWRARQRQQHPSINSLGNAAVSSRSTSATPAHGHNSSISSTGSTTSSLSALSLGSVGSGNTKSGGGFVNYTPDDHDKILHGVAPSGSSKTKARREREASEKRARWEREQLEKRRKLSVAAEAAVRAAGGDVEVLHGALEQEEREEREEQDDDLDDEEAS
ncbi:MAG: hypothetical protein M1838_000950 [Thelocarpon superellum]|nr:MAG: hypothetical protein M1838_000950 [Thelocarpon superellum]